MYLTVIFTELLGIRNFLINATFGVIGNTLVIKTGLSCRTMIIIGTHCKSNKTFRCTAMQS